MIFWSLLLGVFAVSWVLTLVLRHYALTRSLMDIPNERSSHSVPTPRGGGVAIVFAFTLALPLASDLGLLASDALYSLLGSGLLVAVIGFADDHGHIAAKWRLVGHFIAATWALFWLNGLAPVEFVGIKVDLGWFGNILAAVYLVWMLNLYNFMDGIDALASAEAITVCLGMALVYWCSGHIELVWPPFILAAAVAGFLWWNFPPARIFMGDAGSGFLGAVLAGLTLIGGRSAPELLWSGVILLGVFIVDSTWTLISRLLRGEKVYIAHSNHAYQHAARHYSSHKVVTFTVIIINTLWLIPISLLVGLKIIDGLIGLVIGYLPICALVWKFKSGRNR